MKNKKVLLNSFHSTCTLEVSSHYIIRRICCKQQCTQFTWAMWKVYMKWTFKFLARMNLAVKSLKATKQLQLLLEKVWLLCANTVNMSVFHPVYRAAEAASKDEHFYLFLKRLCQVITELGKTLHALWVGDVFFYRFRGCCLSVLINLLSWMNYTFWLKWAWLREICWSDNSIYLFILFVCLPARGPSAQLPDKTVQK